MTSLRAATVCILIAIPLTITNIACADSSLDARRDAAIAAIQKCLHSKNVASRQCKDIKENIQTLRDVYHQGDKTVLPALLQYSYPDDFNREAFLADPDEFLTTLSQLPEAAQRRVTQTIGETRYGLSRPQFEEIRAALTAIPSSSPNYDIARRCLRAVEVENASLLVNFFPADTFHRGANDFDDFKEHWFTNEFYALDEKPLWPPPADGTPIYRITVLPAFSAPESVALTISPNGFGQVRFRVTDIHRDGLMTDRTNAITPQQVATFRANVTQAQFWDTSTEPPPSLVFGMDGAEWILEGVEDGKYHIVDRWCPSRTPFGKLGLDLFDLAGAQSRGVC